MKKTEICSKLRDHVKEHLSPKAEERSFVTIVYSSVCDALGQENCIQIGSYPRFTSISPLHDLDVLYILGRWDGPTDPAASLADVERTLINQFKNPTQHETQITRQTHSVTISFQENETEVFAVDIVPAYSSDRNEFDQDMYRVPEVLRLSHSARKSAMEENARIGRDMQWIPSDPRGYITISRELNAKNDDFRKSVKLVKGWRQSCKEDDDDFPLKSFHLEQIISEFFIQHPNTDIYDAIFYFFRELPFQILEPRFADRADAERYIDDYVRKITADQRRRIKEARDSFLIKLEEIEPETDVAKLVRVQYRVRASNHEQYLFDFGIPVWTEADFAIVANVQPREGGFRALILDAIGLISVDRKIQFRLGHGAPQADVFKWKVKNDDVSPQPRGEITDHRTKNDPEHTKYRGTHFVECYAIRDGVCIGRSRQNVVLNP
jgi:hypothetical protein